MIKIVMAIQAGKAMQTSPYVFGQKDLNNITELYSRDSIPLTTRVDDVVTTVAIVDHTYTFVVAVPIIKTTNDYTFNEIKTLPVFQQGEGFRLVTQHKYIGINAATNEFILVSATEYNQCIQYPICAVSGPSQVVNDEAPCELRSLYAK